MNQIVADRYAEALFELAADRIRARAGDFESSVEARLTAQQALVDKLDHDLTLVTQTVSENTDLRRLLEHPLVGLDDKKIIIGSLFGPHIAPDALHFLQLLFDRSRGMALEMIQSRFHHLAARLSRRLTVKLTTAMPVAPEELQSFREHLEGTWERQIELEVQVDGDLLGGAVMRVEDQVVDGSVRGRLEALKQALGQA